MPSARFGVPGASTLLSVSTWEALRANRERDRAIAALHLATAQKLAGDATASLSTDPERGIILGMHAVAATTEFGQPPAPAAEGALHASILASRIRAVWRGHKQDVRALSFSPDGTRLATGGDDGLIKIWDVASGRERLSFKGRGGILGIAFNPAGDRVATANPDKTATLWDASTGAPIQSFSGHSHMVTGVAFAPDGKQLATSSLDRTARIWDAASGRELRVLRGHSAGLWSVAFSPDGTRIATAGEDNTARLWDARTGKELLRLQGHQRAVVCVTFSPDGKRLATSSGDRSVRVWDSATGQELLQVVDDASITWVAFSRDGTQLATAGLRTKVWETVHGQALFVFPDRAVSKLAYSPTGTRLAVALLCGLLHLVPKIGSIIALFAALLAGSLAFGPIGLVLAVPALAVAAVFWRYFTRKRNVQQRNLQH